MRWLLGPSPAQSTWTGPQSWGSRGTGGGLGRGPGQIFRRIGGSIGGTSAISTASSSGDNGSGEAMHAPGHGRRCAAAESRLSSPHNNPSTLHSLRCPLSPVFTASHSLSSSPGGSRTASSTAPVPKVCSMCCFSVSPLAPTGTCFTDRIVPPFLKIACGRGESGRRQAATGGGERRRRGVSPARYALDANDRSTAERDWAPRRGLTRWRSPSPALGAAVARALCKIEQRRHNGFLCRRGQAKASGSAQRVLDCGVCFAAS